MKNEILPDLTALLPIQEIHYKGEIYRHVDARALHSFLENKTRFNDWFRRLVDEYGFIENEDYRIICSLKLTRKKQVGKENLFYSNLSKKDERGRKPIDYKITLNMAKEIAMVDKSDQGKRARRYFIHCEEQLSQLSRETHREILAQWQQSRELTKSPFKSMNCALEKMRQRQGKRTAQKHYINEINMLSAVILGESVQKFKTARGIVGDIRAHLTAVQLEQLEYLERANEMLLDGDIADFEERRFKLVAMLANRFKRVA